MRAKRLRSSHDVDEEEMRFRRDPAGLERRARAPRGIQARAVGAAAAFSSPWRLAAAELELRRRLYDLEADRHIQEKRE